MKEEKLEELISETKVFPSFSCHLSLPPALWQFLLFSSCVVQKGPRLSLFPPSLPPEGFCWGLTPNASKPPPSPCRSRPWCIWNRLHPALTGTGLELFARIIHRNIPVPALWASPSLLTTPRLSFPICRRDDDPFPDLHGVLWSTEMSKIFPFSPLRAEIWKGMNYSHQLGQPAATWL